MATGNLIVNVYVDNIAQPAEGAIVEIGQNQYVTNQNGKTIPILLEAPEREYSEHYQHQVRPYQVYTVKVTLPGLTPTTITGVEIFAEETSFQDVYLHEDEEVDTYHLPEHHLWEPDAPKIPEAPIKDMEQIAEAVPVVLSSVFIPEYIIVHDGAPSSTNVSNYYVSFPDYIKNVACNEIYSTWPTETIKANVHAIVSFTLNRVFTEWYRARGYNFTITSSPQYDQKYVHNRTIFASISTVVDQYFQQYLRLPSMVQPFLAQYNDGIVVNNPNWLSQWGSKTLGDQGYTAINILRHYYTSTITLQTASEVEGLPLSFPGFNLTLDSCSGSVQKLQQALNTIRTHYPAIPATTPADGIFGEKTKASVLAFQSIFNLTTDGVVGFSTWYKIMYVYVAVTKLAAGL